IRILARFLRARLAIAEGTPAMLARAEGDARAIAGEKMDWSRPIVDLLRAAIDHARGRRDKATHGLRRAIDGFDAAEMRLHAACARARLGALIGGDEGRAMQDEARAWLE